VDSVVQWQDSGSLRVASEVPPGSLEPGQLLGGLASAAEKLGALQFEQTPATAIHFENPIRLVFPKGEVPAEMRSFRNERMCTGTERT
jgi:hypothetical protein